MKTYSLSELNEMHAAEFTDALGAVYEHSPWVVEAAAGYRPFQSVKSLQASCESVLYDAKPEQHLDLIRAHPDLAAKLAQIVKLTDFSQAEQSRAGFASLAPETIDMMRQALADYRERFGHPFILCVTEHPAEDVLPILEVRCKATAEAERMACLFQISRIAWHRICHLTNTHL